MTQLTEEETARRIANLEEALAVTEQLADRRVRESMHMEERMVIAMQRETQLKRRLADAMAIAATACDSLHGRDYDVAKAICDEIYNTLSGGV